MKREITLKNSCECCGADMQFCFKAYPLDYCLEKSFDIYKCSQCGFGSTANVGQDDLKLVYEGGAYDIKEKIWHKLLRPALNLLEITKVSYLKNTKATGKLLLEVGTGKGNFLVSAIGAGFDGYGIEPSTRSFKIARQKLGDRVQQCALQDLHKYELLDQKYDYIFLWHVLEHLADPDESIQLLRAHLKPNGLMIFGVPNFNSFQSRYGGRYWYHLDPPRHLSHFTPKAISYLFKKTDLVLEKIHHNSFFQNFLGEIITLNNILVPHKNIFLNILRVNGYYYKRTGRMARGFNFIASLLVLVIGIVPMLIWTQISQWIGCAGTMVIVASNKSMSEKS